MRVPTRGSRHTGTVFAVFGLLVLGSMIWIGGRAACAEIQADFHPARGIPSLPSRGPLANAELAMFRSDRGDDLRGWWLRGNDDSAIVFLHGTGADRAQLAPQAEILAKHGYSVLLFDLPGHGESGGRVTWSQTEPSALRAALAFAEARGARHFGVVGFSAGAMIAVHEAHGLSIEGLVLEGALEKLDSAVRRDYRRWGLLSQWPAVWATRWAGYRPAQLGPIDPHCQVLFIAGSLDQDVPVPVTRELMQSVHGDTELWIVEGAKHGDYQNFAPAEFEQRLVSFFERAFSKPTGTSTARPHG